MTISNKTRKQLWAKSGNRCAICRKKLNQSDGDRSFVLGEECHTISKRSKGPRHTTYNQYDDYDNLILLCLDHHKIVDEVCEKYSIERLRDIKSKHEKWVEQNLGSEKTKNDSTSFLVTLPRISTGIELKNMLPSDIHSYNYENIDPNNANESVLSFLDLFGEYNDIWNDLSTSEKIEAACIFNREIESLKEQNFVIFGKKEQRKILCNNEKIPMMANYLFIQHINGLSDPQQNYLVLNISKNLSFG